MVDFEWTPASPATVPADARPTVETALQDWKELRSPAVLLAEDDAEFRSLLARALREEGFEVTECDDGSHLLVSIATSLLYGHPTRFDLIISDIRMPGATALQVLEALAHFDEMPPVILITAFGTEEISELASRLGAWTLLNKPFELDDLLREVSEALFPNAD